METKNKNHVLIDTERLPKTAVCCENLIDEVRALFKS